MNHLTYILALFHLATLSLAAPLEDALIEERQFLASLTFYGAGPDAASFFQQVPADDRLHEISEAIPFPLFPLSPLSL